MDGKAAPASADPADDLTDLTLDGPAVSIVGDLWELGSTVCSAAMRSRASLTSGSSGATSRRWW